MNVNRIQANFSRHAHTYESAARCQKHAAEVLAEELSRWLTRPPRVITELGIGTGLVTRELFRRFPETRIFASDLSPVMLAEASEHPELKERLKEGQLTLSCSDLLSFPVPPETDLLVSGLTFQWLPSLQSALEQLRKALAPGTVLAFSTLTDRTFAELRTLFKAQNIPYPGPELLREEELLKAVENSGFKRLFFRQESYPECYESLRGFLCHLRETGAVNASGVPLRPEQMRKLLTSSRGSFSSAYELGYMIASA